MGLVLVALDYLPRKEQDHGKEDIKAYAETPDEGGEDMNDFWGDLAEVNWWVAGPIILIMAGVIITVAIIEDRKQ